MKSLAGHWALLVLGLLALTGCEDECTSGGCGCQSDPSCLAPLCSNQRQDGDETGTDCGGSCAPCAEAVSCTTNADCSVGDCVGGVCSTSSVDPGAGGTGGSDPGTGGSAGVPAGGCTSACPVGNACTQGDTCASGVCAAGVCSTDNPDGGTGPANPPPVDPPPCSVACAVGYACTGPEGCASAICSGGFCGAVATCGDSVLNGTETATDCGGGACAGCGHGAACELDRDCASFHCIGSSCVVGPSAGFSLSVTAGTVPLSVTLSSSAAAGDAAIASIQYDFGEGDGFGGSAAHIYNSVGNHTITQLVTDANGLTATTTRLVQATPPGFTPVLLSATDHSAFPLLLLSPDRLGVEIIESELAGARSDRSIVPGSGMFYFEGERTTELLFDEYFGVATSSVPLDERAGNSARSFGADSAGGVNYNGVYTGATFDVDTTFYGFVVDYRGPSPIVHVLANNEGDDRIEYTAPLTGITDALYIFVGGRRRKVGEQARINPGNDTTNFPFHYDPVAALNAGGFQGGALTRGWGQTRAAPADIAPSLNNVSSPVTIALGSPVTLTATATDAEDGPLSATIQWADLATTFAERDTHVGASWTFTPRTLGIHPIEISVRDSVGRVTSTVVDVTVTGTLPQFDPVQLVADDRGGEGVLLDGTPTTPALSAQWTANGKYGIRANQGMIGEFQYFEMHRLRAPDNQGGGVVIKEGDLAPYNNINVPPSCSVNDFESIWQDLISVENYDVVNTNFYGFAVDYRGRHPIVYVITHDGTSNSDIVAHIMELQDVTVPIYPMIYGNPLSGSGFDASINFGATPFHYNPVAVLGGAGAGLEVGWGNANTP